MSENDLADVADSSERIDIKTTSSVQDAMDEKPAFGSRFLLDESQVWTQNAWDHVPPPDDQDDIIAAALAKQRSAPVPDADKRTYNEKPAKFWENFYKNNANNFFKDRKWLHNEFPELVAKTKADAGPATIAEIGCGAGNSVFPLLASNQNPDLFLLAYDYSHHAVKLVQNNPLYLTPPVGTIHAEPWDLSSQSLPPGVNPGTVDIVILVFVLSALHPDEWSQALTNIHTMLKPGGKVMFRDYGRHDLTQLRFKGGRLLDQNFYIRGDKTRVYFFDLDELSLLFTGARMPEGAHHITTSTVVEDEISPSQTPGSASPVPLDSLAPESDQVTTLSTATTLHTVHPNLPFSDQPHPLFSIEQLGLDRRLIVNRKRQIKMYRVWMQGKFQKVQ